MKTELTIISDELNHGIIDENEARTLLLDLLGVSGSLLPDEKWISKTAPLDPDATDEDVLIYTWWIVGAKDYRDELLRRLQQ